MVKCFHMLGEVVINRVTTVNIAISEAQQNATGTKCSDNDGTVKPRGHPVKLNSPLRDATVSRPKKIKSFYFKSVGT